MYDHLGLKVKDLDASVRFYTAALAPLGYVLCSRDESARASDPRTRRRSGFMRIREQPAPAPTSRSARPIMPRSRRIMPRDSKRAGATPALPV
jgi:hypothetical protein